MAAHLEAEEAGLRGSVRGVAEISGVLEKHGFATARPHFDPVRRGGAIQRNKLRLGHTALANLIVYVALRAAQVPDADDS